MFYTDSNMCNIQNRLSNTGSHHKIGIIGKITALDCKSSLNTNCRIGLAVGGFESLSSHKKFLVEGQDESNGDDAGGTPR